MSNISQFWVRLRELETSLKAEHEGDCIYMQPIAGGTAVEVDFENASRLILAGSHSVATAADIEKQRQHGIAAKHLERAQTARSQGRVEIQLRPAPVQPTQPGKGR